MSLSDASSAFDWDIFCRVVDNFGDIGVCWRLARCLARDHGCAVRLWVDDWASFARLCPAAGEAGDVLRAQGVEVRRWSEPFPDVVPARAVVEAFACEPPPSYVEAMAACTPRPQWINLEYLSAEDWVEDCHGLSSPHPRLGLTKRFCFPGFTPRTGGLLREKGLIAERERFRADAAMRRDWLAGLGIPAVPDDTRLVSLFAYEQPQLPELLRVWAAAPRPTLLLVPEGRVLGDVLRFFGRDEAKAGEILAAGGLTAAVLPFLDAADYDRLLWACALNFVRGEDSFVRAQWAAQPFVWHIYEQDEAVHHDKLEAFLARYLAGLDAPAADATRAFWQAWNGEGSVAAAWPAFAAALPRLVPHTRRWSDGLAERPDLASTLVLFSELTVK
ncbi:elongation factor P maturation arginine rhamnosyltransferase EarP [Aromatoleum toluclasticum]|uniref:elongation factor P maturation arginine rhamnosyltransferase EarP n=1 Tax=Aromatoleum toluclasticum TaxID=92003 RepID=UPI001D1975CA|nr:elongation factor P maturation arginine rhamnosyltransferase EarP [Aromatoleum toluclasticum]MCC4114521.1 elongation factor P maturation arginine rhamnosyltransferase EarP [Aromatoleum toluclasticum]